MDEKYSFNLYPSYIDNTNFRYIKVDDKYIASIVIYDFPVNIYFTQVIDSIDKNYLYDLALYIKKQDTLKVLKDLSYYISTSKAELKTLNESQIDIDILNRQQLDSKELRKKIQINNEEVFKFNFIITFYSLSEPKLYETIKNFQSKLYSKQLYSNITNFRNLDSYLLTLPLNNYNNKLLDKTYRNITTSALCNIFPFYSRNVFDKNGIVFGYTKNENRLCLIDIFDTKYLNSNITIFGSSGSGKSYFAKLLVLRHFLKGKTQYIFDFEKEYVNLAGHLNINVISFKNALNKNYINIMQINEADVEIYKENVLNEKISEVIYLLKLIDDFTLNEENLLKKAILKSYKDKDISYDLNSLYKVKENQEIYITKKIKEGRNMPCLKDVLNYITNKKLYNKLDKIINKYVELSNYSNIDILDSLVFDTNRLDTDEMEVVTYYFLNTIVKYLKNNIYKDNVIIYIDEIWKYIKLNKNVNIASLINLLYKSIRKNKASIVTITQDISDLFSQENINYGKGILNNSEFKIFFKLEFSDRELLDKLNIMTRENLANIARLEKQTMLMGFLNNISMLKIKASNYEHKIIEGEIDDEDISSIK